jgi:hypothetical protein
MMTNEKKIKIVYWVSTIPVLLLFAMSAVMSFSTQAVASMAALGYPAYFVKLLGIAKGLGVISLLVDRFPRIKEWAYAGFTFDVIFASASILAINGSPMDTLFPLVVLVFLAVSYFSWHRLEKI